ncbi:hypothetical protein [Gracilibacillus saliphilus]|nr:hypothetical protein [Gracilibacillus saliphilus]
MIVGVVITLVWEIILSKPFDLNTDIVLIVVSLATQKETTNNS